MQNYGYSYDNILNIVDKSIKNNRLFHACIIYGDPGTRKSYLSHEIIRKILHYQKGSTNCILKSPDLYLIPNQSSIISVDDIRNIKHATKYTSIISKHKIVMIDDIDRMNANASNALLRILEEPIGQTTFILNTSRIGYLLKTISSRCIKIKLRKTSIEDFIKILKQSCNLDQNINLNNAYKVCNGDINLAIALFERKYLHIIMNLQEHKVYDEALHVISMLELNNHLSIRILQSFITVITYQLIDKCYLKHTFIQQDLQVIINLKKIQHIMSNIELLNKKYSIQIITKILYKCFGN